MRRELARPRHKREIGKVVALGGVGGRVLAHILCPEGIVGRDGQVGEFLLEVVSSVQVVRNVGHKLRLVFFASHACPIQIPEKTAIHKKD